MSKSNEIKKNMIVSKIHREFSSHHECLANFDIAMSVKDTSNARVFFNKSEEHLNNIESLIEELQQCKILGDRENEETIKIN